MGYEREVEAGSAQQATEQAEDLSTPTASTGNVSSTQHHQNHQHRSKINFPALGAVAFACFTMSIVLCLVAPTLAKRRRRRRHLQTAMHRAAASANQEDASVRDGIRQQAPEKRYANIEAWLVAKTVLGHDDVCDRVLATKTMTSSRSSGSLSTQGESASVTNRMTTKANHMTKSSGLEVSAGNNENNSNISNYSECPICFDTIEPGDIVSWSPQPDCKHVFHHECIKGMCLLLSYHIMFDGALFDSVSS